MTKFFIVKETKSSSPYALVIHSLVTVKSYPLVNSANEWSQWVNDTNHSVNEIVNSLGLDLESSDSQTISLKNLSAIKDAIPDKVYEFIKTLSHQSSLEFTDNVRGYGRRYVVKSDIIERKRHQGFQTKSANQTKKNSTLKRQSYIDHKAATFRADNTFSELVFNVKAARAMWDPKLGPSGGWRCPTGSRFGGYITDRFGRGCGGGIIRRVGRALVNAGRGLDNVADRRDRRRLNRAAERAAKPGGGRGRERAARAARGLERGARRLLQGEEIQADVANRRVRRNIDRPVNVGAPQRPQRRPGSRPVRRPVTENRGRRGEVERRVRPQRERNEGQFAPGWKPGEYRPGDKNRIAQRENRYAKVTTDQLYRALELNTPRDLKPGETADVEARRRQERLEILQELINRDLDIPERYKREAKIYRLKKQRKQGAKPKGNDRVARALERAARRVVGGEGGRNREERRKRRSARRADRRERIARGLERGARRLFGEDTERNEQRRKPSRGAIVGGSPGLGQPRNPRERTRSAVEEQAQRSPVRKPQRKRRDVAFDAMVKDGEKIDSDLRQMLSEDYIKLMEEWRKRLGGQVTREKIDKYIADREGIRPPAFVGALKAKANDWNILGEFFDTENRALNEKRPFAGEERISILEKLGPTRKRNLRERMAQQQPEPKTRTPEKKPSPPVRPRTPSAPKKPSTAKEVVGVPAPKISDPDSAAISVLVRQPKREQLLKVFAPLPDEPGQIPEVRPIINPKIQTLAKAKEHFDNGGDITDIPQQFWHRVISANANRNDDKKRVTLIQRNGGAIKTVEVYAFIGQQQGFVFNKGKRQDNEGLNEVMGQNFLVALGLNLAPARMDGNDGAGDKSKAWAVMPFAWNFAPPGKPEGNGPGQRNVNYKRNNLQKLPDKAVRERMAALLASYSLGIIDRHSGNTLADVFVDENGVQRPYVAPIDLGWFGRGTVDLFGYAMDNNFGSGYNMDTEILFDIKTVLGAPGGGPGKLSTEERIELHKDLLNIYDEITERVKTMTQITRQDFISQQKANFSDQGLGLSPQEAINWEKDAKQAAERAYDRLVVARGELANRRDEFIQNILGGSKAV